MGLFYILATNFFKENQETIKPHTKDAFICPLKKIKLSNNVCLLKVQIM